MNTDILIAEAATPPIHVLCAGLKWSELLVPRAREAVRAVADEFMDDHRGNEVTFVKYPVEPSWKISTALDRGTR